MTIAVAVVFLPGIMGSRLEFAENRNTLEGGLPAPTSWDPDSNGNMGQWSTASSSNKRAQFDPSNQATFIDTGTECTPEQLARGWGSVSQRFYFGFLDKLQRELAEVGLHRCSVFAFPYDWRMPNQVNAGKAARFLSSLQTKGFDRIVLITHSMGGLVSRFLTNRADGKAAVEAVIHLAQPVDGAVVAYRRLLGGTEFGADEFMRLLLGGTPEEVAEIVSGLQSAVELLPSPHYRPDPANPASWWLHERKEATVGQLGIGPDPNPDRPGTALYEMYQSADWPPSAVPTTAAAAVQHDLRSRLRRAQKSWNVLRRNMHAATWSIYGTGRQTDVQVELTRRPGEAPEIHFDAGRFPEGDGTVPAASAAGLFNEAMPLVSSADPELFRQFEVSGVVHDGFCLDAKVQDGVVELIRAILTPPRTGEFGSITWDRGVFWTKLAEALYEDPHGKHKDTEAELRVAKLLRQEGEQVHLLAKSETKGVYIPDMRIGGTTGVDVKRIISIDSKDSEQRLAHGAEQVGPGGIVIMVYTEEAKTRLHTPLSRFQERARELEAKFPDVTFRVVEEDKLPPLLGPPAPR